MFENLGLKTKILLGSGLTLSFLATLGLLSLNSISTLSDTNERVDHTHEVIQQAMQIEAAAVDMETGMRGYLLAGNEAFLSPYNQGKRRFEELTTELKLTVNDNPAQVTLLGDIENVIQEWQSNVTESAIALRREIGDSDTMNDMALLVGEARGKTYFDRFRGQIATFISREEVLMTDRQAVLEITNNVDELQAGMAMVTHTHEVIQQAMEIEAAAVDMETGMRGYLLAGRDEFLDPYNEGGRRFNQLVNSLKVTVNDNPVQVSLLGEIESTIVDWQNNVTENAIALRREIGDAQTMDDMAILIGEQRGKQYFDQFRGQIASFRDRELSLMTERQELATSAVQNITYTLIIGMALAIFISLIVAYIVSNSITKPFQRIFQGLTSFSVKELNELGNSFGGIVRQMSASSNQVGLVAGNIADVSSNLSQITNRQASSVEETSASTEEISATVQANVKFAEDSRDLSEEMGSKLGELSDAMDKIADSNEQINELVKIIGEIGDKTQIIDEIVFQTKLLSFNASVEAERAGEHGRGFAVVAQEVGNLAQMSGKAATDIATIVKKSVDEAESIARENTKRVDDGTKIVTDTRHQAEVLAKSAKEIFDSSNEQAKGIMEIGNAVESINKATQHAASIADQASASSSELKNQSQELNALVNQLTSYMQGHDNQQSASLSVADNSVSASADFKPAPDAFSAPLKVVGGEHAAAVSGTFATGGNSAEPWAAADSSDDNNAAWNTL